MVVDLRCWVGESKQDLCDEDGGDMFTFNTRARRVDVVVVDLQGPKP